MNTVHGLPTLSTSGLPRCATGYTAEALALRFSDMELVHNVEDVVTLRHLGARRGKLIHVGDGIDLDRFGRTVATRARSLRLRRSLGISANAIVVGMVGQMRWDDGYREFCNAVGDLHRAGYHELAFVIARSTETGESEEVDAAMMADAVELGIHILPPRGDIENVYAAFDVLVLPTHREEVPRAAMEASAMEIPVITTNVRGPRQVVVDGLTGLLVPPHESRRLARAIAQLADAPGTRKAMGIAGGRRAKLRFDHNRVIELTLGVYRSRLRAVGLGGPPSPLIINLRDSGSISLVETSAGMDGAFTRAP